jgi:hypothetical protein
MMRDIGRSKGLPVWLVGLLSLVLVVTNAIFDAVPSSGSPTYSPLIYPSPIPARTSEALVQCPNPKGLVAFTPIATSQAKRETSQVAVGELPATKLKTDPSLWSSLVKFNSRHASKKTPQFPRQEFNKGVPSAPGSAIVASSCGKNLVAKTEVIDVIPLNSAGVRTCNDCTADYYYIDRRGHALLYGVF